MAYSMEQREKLLAVTAPRRKQVVQMTTEYMERTGLNTLDLSRRIGYARPTLNLFLSGRYHLISGDDSAICAAITEFIDAHPVHPKTEVVGKLYETENTRLVRHNFYEALNKGRAYCFRGAPGSQKTFTLQCLIAELNRAEISNNGHGKRAFYVRCRFGIKPTQLMKRVALACGSLGVGDVDRILRNVSFDLACRKVLFVFDEAQHLDVGCMETVRELHDMPPHCGILFAGSHDIEKMFNRLDMEQWHSRVRKATELPGLSEDEAARIVRGELGDGANADFLIKKSYTKDLRKGREVRYISARTLFWAIQAIQERRDVGERRPVCGVKDTPSQGEEAAK